MLVEIVGKRYEEKLITTSLKVAEVFEKEHKNVLQSIEISWLIIQPPNFFDLQHIRTVEKNIQCTKWIEMVFPCS